MASLTEDEIRDLRAKEAWLRFDSIVIGPGARDLVPGWFNNFAEFEAANDLKWGATDRQNAPECYTNTGAEEDFGQYVFQTGVDFITPVGFEQYEGNQFEAGALQHIFTRMLPNALGMKLDTQGVDNMLKVPAIHLPGGTGVTGQMEGGPSFETSDAGQTGNADLRSAWQWPDPLPVPAKTKLIMHGRICSPVKELFAQLAALPTTKSIPITGTLTRATMANWYAIRVWHRGPRMVQLRGAVSSN